MFKVGDSVHAVDESGRWERATIKFVGDKFGASFVNWPKRFDRNVTCDEVRWPVEIQESSKCLDVNQNLFQIL